MKAYTIEIATNSNREEWTDMIVGHFIKEPYFVMECEDGERIMINNDIIEGIYISKEWQSDE